MAKQVSFSAQGSSTDVVCHELWKACAGQLVEIPRIGDRVYYFPQGHLEQLEACMNEKFSHRVPLYKIPSKILCRVIDIQLKAEKNTDQVYALVVLQPEKDTEPKSSDIHPELARPRVFSFAKKLTPSDASTHGGFSVPRKHADECLPPLDMNQPIPSQELVTRDLHGHEWRFKHIFRGQPNRHLLTAGWNSFVTKKRLVANDTFVFLRGEDGELHVGVRRMSRQPSTMVSSIVSGHSMHLGILATASRALSNESSFVVHYKPQTCQFIIGVDKYHKSVNDRIALGMRFKMQFESDEFSDGRYTGRIVGIENFSPQWENSQWRSLKVQWDENASIPRPERVSPWEIEPFSVAGRATLSEPIFNKRPRVPEMSASSAIASVAPLPQRPSDVSSASPPPLATKRTEKRSGRRSRTKVHMEGVAVGRTVDLTAMSGYANLARELEILFDIRGELSLNDKWKVVITNNEGDTTLMGDEPWPIFEKGEEDPHPPKPEGKNDANSRENNL